MASEQAGTIGAAWYNPTDGIEFRSVEYRDANGNVVETHYAGTHEPIPEAQPPHYGLTAAQYATASGCAGRGAAQATELLAGKGLTQEDLNGLPRECFRTDAAHAAAEKMLADMVNQPNHYARFVIEPATFIAANKLPFDVGAIIKYVCRYDAKNGREDVLKARRFCDMLLERIDREARVAAGEDPREVWKVML